MQLVALLNRNMVIPSRNKKIKRGTFWRAAENARKSGDFWLRARSDKGEGSPRSPRSLWARVDVPRRLLNL